MITKITGDELNVLRIGQSQPEGNRFLREATIGKRDYARSTRLEGPIDLGKKIEWASHVLNRNRTGNRVESLVRKRQLGIGIQIVHHPLIQLRIIRHLLGIHSQTDHATRAETGWQVGPPTTHQIQIDPTGWHSLGQKIAQRRNDPVVNMNDLARLAIKEGIIARVIAVKTPVR